MKNGCITKTKGDKSYMKFITQCIMKDWVVLEPIGDNDRFDCVINRGNGFERIQVKTGRYRNGVIIFSVRSSHHHTKKGHITGNCYKNYKNDVEAFGVYCHTVDKCYLIPISKVGVNSMYLRIEEPKNNTKININWAKDYEI